MSVNPHRISYPSQGRRVAPAATVITSGPPPRAASRAAVRAPVLQPQMQQMQQMQQAQQVAMQQAGQPQGGITRKVVRSSQDPANGGGVSKWVMIGSILIIGVLVIVIGVFLYQMHGKVQTLQTANNAAMGTHEVEGIVQAHVQPIMKHVSQSHVQLTQIAHANQQAQSDLAQMRESIQILTRSQKQLTNNINTSAVPATSAVATSAAATRAPIGSPLAPPAAPATTSPVPGGDFFQAALLEPISAPTLPTSSTVISPPMPAAPLTPPIPSAAADPFASVGAVEVATTETLPPGMVPLTSMQSGVTAAPAAVME